MRMGTGSGKPLRRISLTLLWLTVSVASAKKAQPVLEWRTGILWESPDACNETSPVWKDTYLIVDADILYHVAHLPLRRKPNVTERSTVKYALAQGGFYLQDEDGRVFKLSVVKTEQDPNAPERLKRHKQPCQP